MNHLLQSLITNGTVVPQVTRKEMLKYIASLKLNKAPDIYGITSEHLRNSAPVIIEVLRNTTNEIIRRGEIPDSLKH